MIYSASRIGCMSLFPCFVAGVLIWRILYPDWWYDRWHGLGESIKTPTNQQNNSKTAEDKMKCPVENVRTISFCVCLNLSSHFSRRRSLKQDSIWHFETKENFWSFYRITPSNLWLFSIVFIPLLREYLRRMNPSNLPADTNERHQQPPETWEKQLNLPSSSNFRMHFWI